MGLPYASTFAEGERYLFYVLTFLGVVFTCGVIGAMTFLCVRYRARSTVDRSAPPASSRKFEFAWIAVALLLGISMFVWGARIFLQLYTPPTSNVFAYVLGKQWMWKLYHPEGRSEINQLHVPLGAPVSLVLASQDVIHSFAVPAFRVKMDAVPGRYTHLWFTATKLGSYHFFCTQYCGTDHSVMGGDVVVMPPAEYAAWLADGTDVTIERKGEALTAALGCRSCHSSLNAVTAPQLEGLYGSSVPLQSGQNVRADDNYLRTAILEPDDSIVRGYGAVMPSYRGRVSEDDVLAMVAYIKSLARSE